MTTEHIDLQREDIATLARRMEEGTLSARALTAHCLSRIDELDGRTRAVLAVNPEASDIAEALDKERHGAAARGPLHGMPILVKDNIETADNMATTAGSVALERHHAKTDAAVCRSLRAAGAVVLGKTNLSEWANFRSTRSSSGWSSLGGQTRNPYALDRTPGGSSSGSAVAVAAGMCVAAIGTETDGSIVSPAAMTSLVGIKPTVGLIGRTGIIPVAVSQDTAGPMSRTVADGAAVLNVIAQSDPDDPLNVDPDRARPADYTTFLDPQGLSGARVGVAGALAHFHEGVAAIFLRNLGALRQAGATLVDDISVVPRDRVARHEFTVLCAEFKAGINAYLRTLGADAPVRTLAELFAYNMAHEARVMPYFRQEIIEAALAAPDLADETYKAARRECLRLVREESLDRAFREHRLDAIVAPTTCAPWPIDWIGGDNRAGGSAYLAAISGYPAITVPAGYLFGLPIGLTFIARAYDEATVLRLAYAFERHTEIRRPPAFRAHADFQGHTPHGGADT